MKGTNISLMDVKDERNGEERMRVFRFKGKNSLSFSTRWGDENKDLR